MPLKTISKPTRAAHE